MGNWLVPTLLCCIALSVTGYVMLSAPSFQKKLPELREQQIKKMEEAVAAGKATRKDADQTIKAVNAIAQPALLKSVAAVGGLIWGVVRLFWWSLILWWLARVFLKQRVPYNKAMEVAGLSSMIALLSMVVMLVLTVKIGESFGATGFTLSVSDITTPEHRTLAYWALNLVNFWNMAILGTGLARLTGVPWFRATILVVAYWLLSDLLLALLGVVAVGG